MNSEEYVPIRLNLLKVHRPARSQRSRCRRVVNVSEPKGSSQDVVIFPYKIIAPHSVGLLVKII